MSKKLSVSNFAEELSAIIPYIMRLSFSVLSNNSDALLEGRITFPQYIALDVLKGSGSLKMKEIAKALGVSLPAATGLVGRLVGIKMVKRSYDKMDRRVVHIAITSQGVKAVGRIKETRKKFIEEAFKGLSSQEREIYLKIINKVKETLDERNKKK